MMNGTIVGLIVFLAGAMAAAAFVRLVPTPQFKYAHNRTAFYGAVTIAALFVLAGIIDLMQNMLGYGH